MTDEAVTADAGESPDVPAYTLESWSRDRALPGSVPVGVSRAGTAAEQIARIAGATAPGARLGSKDQIRRLCGVSVGTFNEALKLAQARGVISLRPGPGGGIFALEQPPLARMTGWFQTAAGDERALGESIRIRDALAPMLVAEVLAEITEDDDREFAALLTEMRRSRDAHDVAGFVWAAWNVHERFAEIGRNSLLNSLYLTIIDVGTSHLRARLETSDGADRPAVPVWLDGLAEVVEDLVSALRARDAAASVKALYRTDPTLILQPPAGA